MSEHSTTAAHDDDDIEVASALDRLHHTRSSGRTRPVEWRRRQLDALLQLLAECSGELVAALGADMGKPPVEAHFTDLSFTASDIRHTRDHLEAWARPRRAKLRLQELPGRAWIVPEPLGTTLVIAPWNYPVQLTLCPLATALAAGNTVAVKPSELVPRTSALLARLLRERLDPDAVAVFEGGPEVSTELLRHRWDHIFFTGSTTVGRVVAAAAARHLTPTVLELGGKSPVIVHRSANIAVTGRRVAWGKGLNAGQTCIAPDYVLVDRARQAELVDRVVDSFSTFYGSDPLASADLAGIVNDRHVERLAGLLRDHGGTVACGGTVDARARRVAPTVVVDPDPQSALMQEEIFGPVLPVIGVDDLDEAIEFVDARPKPLALYVFADEDAAVQEVLTGTSSGGVCVNQVMMHIGPPSLPFGGVGEAGNGRYHGQAGFDALSNLKSVYRRPVRPELSIVYPPYTRLKAKLLAR